MNKSNIKLNNKYSLKIEVYIIFGDIFNKTCLNLADILFQYNLNDFISLLLIYSI